MDGVISDVSIIKEKCIGCRICKRFCPVGAILGEIKAPHEIQKDICIRCGLCFEKCPKKAVLVERTPL